ncbi:lipopolysaccharide biosynthesis protein [Pseudomonas sp. NPDC089918]|uniref:lipopolysaccharide biosynthesis protein n=1 Tax=Pseudomonas sp. NPDC089918 TaxID=3390654 RepID=UPI003D0385DA
MVLLKKILNAQLISAALRVITLICKLVFVIYLGGKLSLSDLGDYGLIAAMTSYSIYFIGLEAHSYVNRKGIGEDSNKWRVLIDKQLGLYLFTSLVFLVITLLLSQLHALQFKYLYFFLGITLVEHFGQESYRTLIALRDQLAASLSLFFRAASWVIITVIIFQLEIYRVELTDIFSMWLVFGAISTIATYIYISKRYTNAWYFTPKLDYRWSVSAIKTALIFLMATLSLRLMQVLDRVIINATSDKETLGIYVFYTSLSMAASALYMFFGPSRIYPVLVALHKGDDKAQFKIVSKKLLFISLLMGAFFCLAIPSFLVAASFFSNSQLFHIQQNPLLLMLVLGALLANAINLGYQYILYCKNLDRVILLSNCIGLSASILYLVVIYCVYQVDAINVAVAVLLFYLASIAFKVFINKQTQ